MYNVSFSVVYCIIVCNAPFCYYNQNSFWAPYWSSFSSAFNDVLNDLKSTYFALRDHLVNAWCIMVSHSDFIVHRFCMVNVDKSTLINKIICNILRLPEIFPYNITMFYPNWTLRTSKCLYSFYPDSGYEHFINMNVYIHKGDAILKDLHSWLRKISICTLFSLFSENNVFPCNVYIKVYKRRFFAFYVYA